MPIPSVSHKPQRENNNSYQNNVSVSMFESSDATSSHASASFPDSVFKFGSMSQDNSLQQTPVSHALNSQTSSSFSELSYNSNSLSHGASSQLEISPLTPTPFGMSQMFPLHHDTQLEVILPISISTSSDIDVSKTTSVHLMITRSKSVVLPQKSYKGYLAALPELQSLQLTPDEYFGGRFSFLASSVDAAQPTFIKVASIPQW